MNKVRVLIVEDEIFTAEALRLDLQEIGYEMCSLVSSGEKAIETAENERPDIILMDGRLRGRISGFEAAKIIRSRLGIPIIYMSGYSEEEVQGLIEIDEPFRLVTKPLQLFEINEAIKTVLKGETGRGNRLA